MTTPSDYIIIHCITAKYKGDTMNTLSFRTPEVIKNKLDFLASQQQRDRSFIINEAIEYYLSLHEWQLAHIQAGVQQIQNKEFASDKEVKDAFAKWKK